MYRRTVVSGVISALAGCAFPGLDTGPPIAEIYPELQEPAIEDDEVVINIVLHIYTHQTDKQATFNDVSIGCYSEAQKTIAVQSVGTISSEPPRDVVTVTIRAPTTPYYIVAESDEFWSQNQFQMEMSGWARIDSNQFKEYNYSSREDKFSE